MEYLCIKLKGVTVELRVFHVVTNSYTLICWINYFHENPLKLKAAAIMELPGYSGSILSDKTRELYKNVDEFAKKYSSQYNSSIFLSRLLLKPTVVVTDNATVRELLADKEGNFEMGYKEFFYEIYGDVLLFLSGEESKQVRAILKSLMTRDHGNTYITFLEKIMDDWIDKLETSKPVDVYKHLKKMSTHLSLSLFLGIDPAESVHFVDHLIELTTTHWHGIISIPLNVKIPLFTSTTYRKALDAKAELLEIIRERLQVASVGFISQLRDDNRMEFEKQADHILLFVSALVPKALAAILTAFIFSSPFWYEEFVDLKGNMKEEDLLGIILEVERCWPPFIGGRRVANKDCQLGGYLIPKGYGVIYLATSAHRDPSVFSNPEQFIASRWTENVPAQRSTLFTFGAGSRSCIGIDLMEAVILKFCRKLVERFQWEVKENGGILKWMPVSRPKNHVIAIFKPQIGTSEKDQ